MNTNLKTDYIDSENLKGLIRLAQSGDFKVELVDAIRLLVVHLGGDEDDQQNLLLEVVRSLDRIDPERNVFAYLTACAMSIIARRKRREETYDGMIKHYAWLNGWVPHWNNGKRGHLRFNVQQ